MVKNNQKIIIVVILLIAAFLILPKLNLFSIVPYASQCALASCPSGYTDLGASCDDSSRVCTRNCQQIIPESCGSYGSESQVGITSKEMPSYTTWYHTPPYDMSNAYCYEYRTSSQWTLTGMNSGSKTLKIYTKDGTTLSDTKTTSSTSATFVLYSQVESIKNDNGNLEAYGKVSSTDLYSYDSSTLTVKLYVARATYTPAQTLNSPTTCTYETCTENQVVIVGGQYRVCHNGQFNAITDLVLLTPEEQAAVLALINQLQLTVQQKALIIQNLTNTLEGQAIMINQLTALTNEKALIIQQLSANITYQAQLISQMQLTVAEQAATIAALNLNIQQQGQLIAQLQTNLNNKVALIAQLQVENANQAQLIAAMNLSFGSQAYIIQQLQANITNDAIIISNMGYTVQQQAQLINELTLERNQLAQLVAALNLSNGDTALLINQLNLKLNEQIAIIAELNRSIQDEEAIVAQLRATIEEQNAIIESLRNGTIPTEDILNQLQTIWTNYKMWIIIGGAVFLVLALSGGKRR